MNLHESRMVLRPRTLPETFDLAVRWTTAVGGGLYVRLGAVLLLPAALGCYALRAFAGFEWLGVWAVAVPLAMLLQGPFTIAASRLMFESDVTARSVLVQFARRLGAYLVAWITTRVVLGLGGLVVVAAPWAWAHGAFVHEAVLLEQQGGFAGVARSGRFASGQYGTILSMGATMLVALAAFVVGADQLGFVLFDFVLQLGRPFGDAFETGGSLFALLGFFAAIPYLGTVRFLQYIDGRTRRDGWDLQSALLRVRIADETARATAASSMPEELAS